MVDEDKFAVYRKQPLKKREIYRPRPWFATVGEAKEILRTRYWERYKIKVTKIRRRDWHFVVSFGEDKDGRGLGPAGLTSIMCNWPYRYNLDNMDEAIRVLQEEGVLPQPRTKVTKRKKTVKKKKVKKKTKKKRAKKKTVKEPTSKPKRKRRTK